MKYRVDFVTNSSSTSFVQAAIGAVGALAVVAALGSIAPVALPANDVKTDDTRTEEKKEDKARRKLETAVMPEGVRSVVVGSDSPLWLYARMQSAASADADFQPDDDLTGGVSFRVVDGASAVVFGEKQTIGEWVAVGVFVKAPNDGSPIPGTVSIAAERLAGAKYFRRTITLTVLPS